MFLFNFILLIKCVLRKELIFSCEDLLHSPFNRETGLFKLRPISTHEHLSINSIVPYINKNYGVFQTEVFINIIPFYTIKNLGVSETVVFLLIE